MSSDFLAVLNESNSKKDEKTGQIIITVPSIEIEDQYQIKSNCNITSKCNTIIKCNSFLISAASVSISNINFESAVIVSDINDFTMANCTITKSQSNVAALKISECENGTISHVTITDIEKAPGLYIFQNSVIMADHLLIHDISETLLVCGNASFLTITDSQFYNTQSNGIYVRSQSVIDIENCSFKNTSYPALFVNDSQITALNNKFENIDQSSISVTSSKDFRIERNEFTRVNNSAISITQDSYGVISENTFTKVGGNGIFCSESKVEIKANLMTDVTFPGVAAIKNSSAVITNNKIKGVEYSGLSVRGAKDVKIENNEISEVKQSGISVSDTEKCVITGNVIQNCGITAIESYNRSNVLASNNKIVNPGKFAFITFTSGVMKADHNKIDGVQNAMVRLTYKGGGEFVENEVKNCPNQCECLTTSFFYFAKNGQFKGVTNDPSKKSKNVDLDNSYLENDGGLCLMCKKKDRDCYLLECGHQVYCTECAKKALEEKQRCPLCRFPIEKVSSGFKVSDDDTCIVCVENKADCMILPCGHVGLCEKCLQNWLKEKNCCPICRTENVTYKRIVNDI